MFYSKSEDSNLSLNESIQELLDSLHSLTLSEEELKKFYSKYDAATGGLHHERPSN